jgi:hypothetical protein
MNSILEITEFPQPTIIPVHGIELEVFEAGWQEKPKETNQVISEW